MTIVYLNPVQFILHISSESYDDGLLKPFKLDLVLCFELLRKCQYSIAPLQTHLLANPSNQFQEKKCHTIY